ncbi:hypothetical protein ACFWHW_03775 [Streptomyces pharetrae]|uniref:hypothetical protein n=1 Tax=Streptomyces pharetrae TaxID=291370 RepID=UPI00364D5CB3
MPQSTSTTQQPPTPFATPWPDDVTARYLTVAGATVDLTGSARSTSYRCTGCPFGSSGWHEDIAHQHAQAHAERCRALPNPEAQQ